MAKKQELAKVAPNAVPCAVRNRLSGAAPSSRWVLLPYVYSHERLPKVILLQLSNGEVVRFALSGAKLAVPRSDDHTQQGEKECLFLR